MEMPMHRRTVPTTLLGGVVALAFIASLVVAGTASAVSPMPPTLTAKPHSVMVNTDTTVTGRHFTPGTSVEVAECGKTSWPETSNPCTSGNSVTVTANEKGEFRTPFKVEVCPDGVRGKNPTSEKCYIGVLKPSSLDGGGLSPSTSIIVTYP
jgi:hypothetical protein